MALALIGDTFHPALGWLFDGMVGGIATGAAGGALVEPLIGWPGLFLTVAGTGLVLLAVVAIFGVRVLPMPPRPPTVHPRRTPAWQSFLDQHSWTSTSHLFY